MIVPDPTPTFPVGMIHAPITALIMGGHDIDRGNGKMGQVLATLPFEDHDGVRKSGFVQQSIQSIQREYPEPTPLGGEILLTPTGDIVLDLMVGMKFVAVVSRLRFKWQAMHRLGLTIDARLGLLG